MYLRTLEGFRGASVAVLACAMLGAGCVGAPVQEMSDARQAIKAAASAGAEVRAPAKLEAARQLLSSAEEKLYRRAYTGARLDAVEARGLAIEALRDSDSGEPDGNSPDPR